MTVLVFLFVIYCLTIYFYEKAIEELKEIIHEQERKLNELKPKGRTPL